MGSLYHVNRTTGLAEPCHRAHGCTVAPAKAHWPTLLEALQGYEAHRSASVVGKASRPPARVAPQRATYWTKYFNPSYETEEVALKRYREEQSLLLAKLAPEEVHAYRRYQDEPGLYLRLNHQLRMGSEVLPRDMYLLQRQLDQAFSVPLLREPRVLYRGLRSTLPPEVAFDELLSGHPRLAFPGYTSTSALKSVGLDFAGAREGMGILLELLTVGGIVGPRVDEHEYLLPRGTQWRVLRRSIACIDQDRSIPRICLVDDELLKS